MTEQPLLLDPADLADDPLQHIRFNHETAHRWRPIPRNGSRRGAETIRACELDRTRLMDQYRIASLNFEDARIRITEALEGRDPTRITRIWEEIRRRRLSAHMPFVALHRDMLDHHFPLTIRSRYSLSLNILYPP